MTCSRKSFPELLDPSFTAAMEEKLDQVEEGKSDWQTMIRDFYGPFKGKVTSVQETLESIKGVMDEKTDVVCEVCGRPMVKKLGRYGFFLACTGFPECKNTKPVPLAPCPKCSNGQIVARKRKRGQGPGVLRLHQLPHVRLRDVLQADGLEVPEVRLVPGGKGGQAAGDVQVVHQSLLRLPPHERDGRPRQRGWSARRLGRSKCVRNTWPT